jgi:hypothetical protein
VRKRSDTVLRTGVDEQRKNVRGDTQRNPHPVKVRCKWQTVAD